MYTSTFPKLLCGSETAIFLAGWNGMEFGRLNGSLSSSDKESYVSWKFQNLFWIMAFDRSASVSEMTPYKAGQAEPPNVMHKASRSKLSNIVKLSVAVLAASVHQWKAASISILQMNISVLGCLKHRSTM